MVVMVLLLCGCQTLTPLERTRRAVVRSTLTDYKNAINARSLPAIDHLLAKSISIDGLPDELSRAAIQNGVQWLPNTVVELQIQSIHPNAGGYCVRTALYTAKAHQFLTFQFDGDGKIQSISGEAALNQREIRTAKPFTSPLLAVDNLPFVRATIDGRSGYFLIDTGSGSLLLNRKYFHPTSGSTNSGITATINGISQPEGTARIKMLLWGNIKAPDLTGEMHDFSQLEKPAITPLLGAISHRELKNSSLLFDWKRRTIEVMPTRRDGARNPQPGERPPDVRIPFRDFVHLPLIKAQVGTKPVNLLFDSGAQLNILPDTAGIENHFRQIGHLAGFSSGGAPKSAHIPVGYVDKLTIGNADFLHYPFAIYRIPYLQGNGMIGTPLLQQGRVEMNFRARLISIWR